jgi:hypothetical protein
MSKKHGTCSGSQIAKLGYVFRLTMGILFLAQVIAHLMRTGLGLCLFLGKHAAFQKDYYSNKNARNQTP